MNDALFGLVIDNGDPAAATGLVFRYHGELCLVGDKGQLFGTGGVPTGATCRAGLRSVRPDQEFAAFEGQEVEAVGIFRDGALLVEGPSALRRREGPLPERPVLDEAELRVRPVPTPTFRRRSPVEQQLLDDGALRQLWRPSAGPAAGRWVALSDDDPERVRAELTPEYGEALYVVESRWSKAIWREALDLVTEHKPLVCSFGFRYSTDYQSQLTATLQHLPGELARRLDRFPPESLAIDVLVKPA